MDEITAHRIQKVWVLIYNILIVEEEFVRFQQLLLFDHQLVCVLIIFHNLIVFHIVIWYSLSTKHYECVFIDHVKTDKPYSSVNNSMQDNPTISFDVKLLDWCSISSGFIADSINVPVSESTAVWSSHCLLQTWESFLIHSIYLKVFTLFQILTFQWATNNVNKVFELSDSKIYSIIHHLSNGFECLWWNIEQQYLWTWYICTPIKLISLITANNKNVGFVNYNYFPFTDFLIINFKTCPF